MQKTKPNMNKLPLTPKEGVCLDNVKLEKNIHLLQTLLGQISGSSQASSTAVLDKHPITNSGDLRIRLNP